MQKAGKHGTQRKGKYRQRRAPPRKTGQKLFFAFFSCLFQKKPFYRILHSSPLLSFYLQLYFITQSFDCQEKSLLFLKKSHNKQKIKTIFGNLKQLTYYTDREKAKKVGFAQHFFAKNQSFQQKVQKPRLPQNAQQVHRPKVPMAGFVVKGQHAQNGTHATAEKAQREQYRLGGAPFSLFCLSFVGGIPQKSDQGKNGIINQQDLIRLHHSPHTG